MPLAPNKLIVVDDEPDLLYVTTSMLQRNGYQVYGFTDPVKALEHVIEYEECSVVISDVRMPVMNGFELVRGMKEQRPQIKVVLMSSFDLHHREWQQRMPSTGVDQVLKKPFSMSQLIEAVEKCISLVS